MTTVVALVLVFGGLVGVVFSWNAARPVIDPTRRYSPWWLPAMVVSEIAPFALLLHIVILVIGVLLGGAATFAGRLGVGLLALSIALLTWVLVRSLRGARQLRSRVSGMIHPGRGRARLLGRPVTTPTGVEERHDIVWAGGHRLDIIRPAGASGPSPVMVYVHGGGWTGGDPQRQGREMYHALARDGWVVAAIRYPFAPAVSVEQQIQIVTDAVRWVRTASSEHIGAPTAVVLAGGSAGAHLATMAALAGAVDAATNVDACVGIYGVYDMANRNRTRATWTKIPREVMQATVDDAPERYRAVSPIDQVHAETPPFLIVHGTHDTLVPIAEGEQFVDVLRAADRPVDFVPVYGAQHAFDALSSPTTRAVAAVVRTWLRQVVIEPAQAPTAW